MSSNAPDGPDEDEQDTDRRRTPRGPRSDGRGDGPRTGETDGSAGPQAGSGPQGSGDGGEGIDGNHEVPEWLSVDPDEEVVWVGEPSITSMIGTVLTGVVLVPVLIGILILVATPVSYLTIENTDFVVTSKSLYVKKGVLSTNIETVDLDRIQNTEYSQSFWGKQLGYGNIEISTAGSSGTDITFRAIGNARAVRERISTLSAGAGTASTGGDDKSANRAQLEELVSELRATRQALERVEAEMDEKRGDDRGERASDREQGHEETSTDY